MQAQAAPNGMFGAACLQIRQNFAKAVEKAPFLWYDDKKAYRRAARCRAENSCREKNCMTIREVVKLLDAEILCGEDHLDTEIHTACGSDMMSDVLAYVKDQSVLLTGLLNPQVVRTAEMMDMLCIVFVRGKKPDAAVIELAKEKGIVLLSTDKRLFVACGILYTNGLGG